MTIRKFLLIIHLLSVGLYCIAQTSTPAASPVSANTSPQEGPNKKDVKGRKQGPWKKYEKGVLKYEGTFADDRPIGVFTYYFDNGSVKAINRFSNSGRICYAQLFYPSGKKMADGKYIDQKKDSTWNYYDENEIVVLSETYKNNKKNGPRTTYYEDGKPSEQKNYKDDSLYGIWKKWYPSGQLKETSTHVNNKLHGQYIQYFEDGSLCVTGFYTMDFKEGEWIFYKRGGEIKVKVKFKHGEEQDMPMMTPAELEKARLKYQEMDQQLRQGEIPRNIPK